MARANAGRRPGRARGLADTAARDRLSPADAKRPGADKGGIRTGRGGPGRGGGAGGPDPDPGGTVSALRDAVRLGRSRRDEPAPDRRLEGGRRAPPRDRPAAAPRGHLPGKGGTEGRGRATARGPASAPPGSRDLGPPGRLAKPVACPSPLRGGL